MPDVVGVALLEGTRVLAARRAGSSVLAGRWELPGGKVEPGEDPAVTAVREIGEELGCAIEVTGWLEGRVPVLTGAVGLVLRVATARITEGDPVPGEHDAVRWLRADQLDQVAWSEADVPFLAQVRELLLEPRNEGRSGRGAHSAPGPA